MNLLKMYPLLNMGIFHCYVSFPGGRSIFFFPTYSHFKKWTCNNFRGWRLLWMKFTHSKKITWWFTFDQKSQEIVVVFLLKSFSDFIFMDIDFSACINCFLLWFIFLKKTFRSSRKFPNKNNAPTCFFHSNVSGAKKKWRRWNSIVPCSHRCWTTCAWMGRLGTWNWGKTNWKHVSPMKKTLVVFRRFVGDEKLPEVYRGIILSRYIGIILSIGIYI